MDFVSGLSRMAHRREIHEKTVNRFLGAGRRTASAAILPRYYRELLTWALHQYLERHGWKIIATLGYHEPEPIYTDVDTGNGTCNLLIDGQMLTVKGDFRAIITVDTAPRGRSSIQLEGLFRQRQEIEKFIRGVLGIAKKENFYRGKKIEFAGTIRFLEVGERTWENIILDPEIKREIRANTVDFLRRKDSWAKYGIPLKRGVLLAGEPGTGKTVICKALMNEADGITCIITSSYDLDDDYYITALYELAADLSPCIVFIEDIDLIGQNRMETGYMRGPALLSLLSVMDGIEEQQEIVTVATTNCLEALDKALSQRPSRFDRIIKLMRPSLEQRRELIRSICAKIPLAREPQEYIAMKADNCTPAQLQEIIYSLVITQPEAAEFGVKPQDIDRAISKINDKSRNRLGFTGGNHGGDKLDFATRVEAK